MKKIVWTMAICMAVTSVFGQAYKGRGDKKFGVSYHSQSLGSGIQISSDLGKGENISFGIVASYLLSAEKVAVEKLAFSDRFDAKVRMNANIGSVLNLIPAFDVYPGLNLGLKNFGAHIGARYMFSSGIGIYSEVGAPISKYSKNDNDFNNKSTFVIGAVFNM